MERVLPIWLTFALLLIALSSTPVKGQTYCKPGDDCWPTDAEVAALYNALDPTLNRTLVWGEGLPRVMSVPLLSPDDQPLYGLGFEGLKPVYSRTAEDATNTCFQPLESPYISDFCRAATRNSPYEGWSPGFVAWPLTTAHVETLVKFAVEHNLCIMVAGTGHDFINRHSCPNGLFIRLSLMKSKDWNLTPTAEAPYGKVKWGPGNVFSEAHVSAAQHDRVISSGWASTVGVVGWSIGGGHGPFAPAFGLGVDNILEIEIVLANGTAVTANSTLNPDLLWAIRGGGGSTWGIITALTMRAHPIPSGGFTRAEIEYEGCNSEIDSFYNFIDNHFKVSQSLSTKWGMLTFFTPGPSTPKNLSTGVECPNGGWEIRSLYVYQGSANDSEFIELRKNLTSILTPFSGEVYSYKNWGDAVLAYGLEPIAPIDMYAIYGSGAAGVPSVLISRETVASGAASSYMKQRTQLCVDTGKCGRYEFYNDITGAVDSPRDPNVSIGDGFRNALIHHVVGALIKPAELQSGVYVLGNNSYFSESAYAMPNKSWYNRYWGANNTQRLLQIKKKYDPKNFLGCHHCVGSKGVFDGSSPLYPPVGTSKPNKPKKTKKPRSVSSNSTSVSLDSLSKLKPEDLVYAGKPEL